MAEQDTDRNSAISEANSSALPNVVLVKSICDQEIERLKFIACLGSLLEDFTDVENSTAKSYGKTISVFSAGKNDFLSSYGNILEELSKFATQSSGRNHAAIANNISGNVCKLFPEYSKINRKKVQSVLQRVVAVQDDLKKAKAVQLKNEENYVRLVKEAEICVRFRDNPDLDEKTMEAERESLDDKEKYKNMSFSKMISKMTANDKKTPTERVAEIVREVDMEERQLEANSKRLAFCRANLIVEVERALADVISVENSRVHTLIDGFMKVFAIFDQFNHKVGESSLVIEQQLINLQFDSSLHIPGDLPISECSGLTFIPIEEWTEDLETMHGGIPQVAVKVERFLDILDNCISYLQRSHQLFDDITDVERARNRSFKKLLEKYDAPTTAELLSHTSSMDSLAKLNKYFASELSELFPVRQMTASLILLLRTMSDISARTGDLSVEDVCKEIGAAQKRVTNLRKDLKEGYALFLKTMETNYGNFSKLRAKLQKTQAFLKERNATLKQAKTSAGLDGGIAVPAPIPGSSATPEGWPAANEGNSVMLGGGEDIQRATSPSVERTSLSSVVTAATAAAAAAAANGSSGSASTMTAVGTTTIAPEASATSASSGPTAEGNSLYRMASMKNKLENFGSSLRSATKLKQVVGLETPTDRIHRIENQIVGLEKEERELQVQTKKAQEDLAIFMSQSSMDLVNRLMSSKSDLLSDLDQSKNSLLVFIEWSKEKQQLMGKQLSDLKIRLDVCEKISDRELFLNNAETAVVKFEIPDIDPFVPLKSEIIEEERKHLKAVGMNGASGMDAIASPRASIIMNSSEPLIPLDSTASSLLAENPTSQLPSAVSQQPTSSRGSVLLRSQDVDSDDEVSVDGDNSNNVATTSSKAPSDTASVPSRKYSDADSLPSPPVGSPLINGSSTLLEKKAAIEDNDKLNNNTNNNNNNNNKDNSESVSQKVIDAAPPSLTPAVPATIATSTTSNINMGTDKAAAATTTTQNVNNSVGLPSTSSNTAAPAATTEYELRKFGLDPSNKILESFSCALYPKRGILTQGRLFITQHYVAFSGWTDTRVLLPLANVTKVEKTNTLKYIPNAISITCFINNTHFTNNEGDSAPAPPGEEEYFFGSFIEREACFNLVRNLSEIEKRIAEISSASSATSADGSEGTAKPALEFGYQTHTTMFNWSANNNNASTAEDTAAATGTPGRLYSAMLGSSQKETANASTPSRMFSTSSDVVTTPGRPNEKNQGVGDEALIASPDGSAMKQRETTAREKKPMKMVKTIVTRKIKKVRKVSPAATALSATVNVDNTHLKKLESMIADNQLIVLAKKSIAFSCHHFFRSNLLRAATFTQYLESQGDFDVSGNEWESMQGQGSVPEDVTKTNFQWKRRFNNMHPRTTMLMFGPKNCSVKQDQYLSLLVPTDVSENKGISLENIRIYGGVLLAVYEFDGIPMGDVFKVLQYYIFTPSVVKNRDVAKNVATVSTDGKDGCAVVVGLTIHFRKSTMFKSQIISGSSEESGGQARHWLDTADKKVTTEAPGFLELEAASSSGGGGAETAGEEEEEYEEDIEEEIDMEVEDDHVLESTASSGGSAAGERLHTIVRRRSSGRLSHGGGTTTSAVAAAAALSQEEQKSVLSQAATTIVERTVASIRKEYDWQLLVRDRIIQGLLGTIILAILFIVYLYYNTNAKVATLEKLLQKHFQLP